jgi:hypothetical protein
MARAIGRLHTVSTVYHTQQFFLYLRLLEVFHEIVIPGRLGRYGTVWNFQRMCEARNRECPACTVQGLGRCARFRQVGNAAVTRPL